MRRPSIARLVMILTGTAMVWLLGAATADAHPLHRRGHRHTRLSRAFLEARALHRAIGRSLVHSTFSMPRRLFIRKRPGTLLRRNHLKGLTEDDQAIQNGSAVGGQDDIRLLTALEPIGLLVTPQCQITSNRSVARLPPRGPPPGLCAA
jgi:hypothetical protein